MSNGSKIGIPVSDNCTIKVTYYYSADAKIGDVPFKTSSGSDSVISYQYKGGSENGYVEINAYGNTYIKKIELSEADTNKYTVTLNLTGDDITATDLSDAEIVFTDLKGNAKKTATVQSGESGTSIAISEIDPDAYTIAVYKSGAFVQQNVDDILNVSDNCSHEISFKSYLEEWDFSDPKFQSTKYDSGYAWYAGLEFTNVKNQSTVNEDGLTENKYAVLEESSVIQIPVKKSCDITIDYYEKQDGTDTTIATIKGESESSASKEIKSKGEGGNDYKVTYNNTDNDSTYVEIKAEATFYISKISIDYLEQDYDITIKPMADGNELTADDLKGAVITFTDTSSDKKDSFTIGDGDGQVALDKISLKEGTYSISVYNSNVYVQKATSNFTVSEAGVEDDSIPCVIEFDAYPISWNFNDPTYINDYKNGSELTWYNGLEFEGDVYTHNSKYAYMGNGGKVRIPVKGEATIELSLYPSPNITVDGKTLDTEGTSEPVKQTYEYKGEKGYVDVVAGGTTYLISIKITYPTTSGGGNEGGNDEYTPGIDVWDFGAEQLQSTDEVKYNNKLTVDIINGWYPDTVEKGSSGNDFPAAGFKILDKNGNVDFMFNTNDKSNHRLRTTNANLTRKDEKSLAIGNTTYSGYIYSNSGSEKNVYIGVRLNAGDVMTAVVSSNGGNYTIGVEDSNGSVTEYSETYDSKNASIITYYASTTGLHKIYSINEKLVIARVTREHNQKVKVSGDATFPEDATEELKLTFTSNENEKLVSEAVVNKGDKSYEVELFENHSYSVMVTPTKYVLQSGAELTLGPANDTLTATHNVEIVSVILHKLSGSINGLDEDAISKVTILLEKPEDMLYIPVVDIDRSTGTYEAYLQDDVEYQIVTENINDYELDKSVEEGNEATIKITQDTENRDITYTKKPTYVITIEGKDQNGEANTDLTSALAKATFTFTNLNEEGYVYTFDLSKEGTDGIKLRNGTYDVKVTNSGQWVQKLTSNLEVNGAATTKEIRFSNDITQWIFSASDFTNGDYGTAGEYTYNGLHFTNGRSHNNTYLLHNAGTISVPVKGASTIIVKAGYEYSFYFESMEEDSYNVTTEDTGGSTAERTHTYKYTGNSDHVDITVAGQSYINSIEVLPVVEYKDTITVGKDGDYDYETINDALDAVRKMERTEGTTTKPVTIEIQPGNYEEMLVIDVDNIKLVNASQNPSIELKNKGVDIDDNAVRITSYYGVGYSYYSMDNNCKWDEEILAVNKENGYHSMDNPPNGGTTNNSYWNATVSINASNISAEGIIFENSFNQYISKKAEDDVLVKQSGAKEGSVPRSEMKYGDTTVQQKAYVERAAALAIYNNCAKISFDNCKFIGHQDTLYGGTGVTAAFYDCSIYGGTDYIFGGMTAVFAKCDLVFNTDGSTSTDVGYITAPQQSSGRGYLMYNCHVTSTTPGVDTAAEKTSQPGYFGRPWTANTGEAVFYMTVVDAADTAWSSKSKSLILPVGWDSGLSGESALSQEYGTYELPDGTPGTRVSWATVLTDAKLKDGKPITVETFLGDWDAFAGKDMSHTDYGKNIPAPQNAPTITVTPEAEAGNAIKTTSRISLTAAEGGSEIYYNINEDDDPDKDSVKYTGEFRVTGAMVKDGKITIKARAARYGVLGPVSSEEYTVEIVYSTVTFDSQGGSTVESKQVETGDVCPEPEAPTKEGHVFDGWYKDSGCTEEYDFNTPVEENEITLYAKWLEARTVTFVTGEGETERFTQIVGDGKTVKEPEEPTKDGKVFDGWYTDSACADEDKYDFTTPVESDITLYAKWLTAYTVTFDTDGGSDIPDQIVGEGKTAKKPEDPTKEGYAFDSWYTSEGEQYNFNTPVTSDITLYAKWTKNSGPETGDGSGLVVTLVNGKDYTYTGSAITPEIEVTNNSLPLVEGIDYTVKYSNNVKVTTNTLAKVTVTGKGNLSGSTSDTFNIKPKSLADTGEGAVEGDTVYVASGSKATPVLSYGGVKLTTKDFDIIDGKDTKWTESKEDGITIRGKGNFIDERTLNVVVLTKDEQKKAKIKVTLTKDANNLIYNGEDQELPEGCLTVTNAAGDTDLKLNEDYVVSYPSDIKSAGKKKITIMGTSEKCVGTVNKTYTIKPALKTGTIEVTIDGTTPDKLDPIPFTSTGVTLDQDELKVTYTGTEEGATPVELKLGTDYKITYSGNKKPKATAKFTITGLGNFKGVKAPGTFAIGEASLDSDNIAVIVPDKLFTKPKAFKSTPYVIETLSDESTVLLKSSNYKVTYWKDADATQAVTEVAAGDEVYVKLEGKGVYKGSDKITDEPYTIVDGDKDLSTAKIAFYENAGDQKATTKLAFTGEDVKPAKIEITFKDKAKTKVALTLGDNGNYSSDDYEVQFVNNVNKGKAIVIITAADSNNDGSVGGKTAIFSIVAKNLKNLTDIFK